MKILNNTIILLMFLLLPIDMINGFLLHNNIQLPFFTLAQIFKVVLLALLLFSFTKDINKLIFCIFCTLLLMLPSFMRCILEFEFKFILQDLIKVSRYLMPLFAFLYFKKILTQKDDGYVGLIFKLVKFSYIIFVFNILLKYVGLGYPIYSDGNIGSKGFFFAGNETSALLIIMSSILALNIFSKGTKVKYFLFFIFNLFIGLTISSKTGILGIFLVFIMVPMKEFNPRIKLKYLRNILFSIFIAIPLISILTWKYIIISPVFKRLEYFWNNLEFVTFVFSNRNNFFIRAWENYLNEYNFLEKIIGIGQTKYEQINDNHIVEIDIADIFFAYGLSGLILFIFLMFLAFTQAKKFRKKKYPYAGLVLLMTYILLAISTLAGHVYSSGMSAIFLGLLFSLMFIKPKINNETYTG